MGSVKDLVVIKKPTAIEPGIGNFVFSDRYSVFDWGEMPDHFINKGKALCLIGAYFFEKLEEIGIKTHYRGLVENDEVKCLSELNNPVDTMQVELLQVIKPRMLNGVYDYSNYNKDVVNFLIPLEIIYRNSLPEGSSVFKRLKNGTLKLEDIGLEKMPEPGLWFEKPIVDVSTKLETSDRYIPWEEAKRIAGINEHELERIKRTTHQINKLITRETERMGLLHEDGKVEFGHNADCQLLLVDVLGTPDECRFTYQGIPLSKEVARIFYRNTPWHAEVEQAKNKESLLWKKYITSPPPSLPRRLNELISLLYMAFCNELTGRCWFETSDLKKILYEMKAGLAI